MHVDHTITQRACIVILFVIVRYDASANGRAEGVKDVFFGMSIVFC